MLRRLWTFITEIIFFIPGILRVIIYGDVTPDFRPCLTFFYNQTVPQGISGKNYVALCQLYKDKYRFATLYDKSRRIPLYSAYILSVSEGSRPKKPKWKVQPELESNPGNREMVYQRVPNVTESQAVDDDYKNSSYTRGHLAPSSHQKTQDDQDATFTLTNIVPQINNSNSGPWEIQERRMLERLEDCTSQMYVITGVMPYMTNEHKINNRVHVPEYMWTAYCCSVFNPKADQNHFPTYAAVGRNDRNSPEDIVKKVPNLNPNHFRGYDVMEMPLNKLEEILKRRLKMPKLGLFKNSCL